MAQFLIKMGWLRKFTTIQGLWCNLMSSLSLIQFSCTCHEYWKKTKILLVVKIFFTIQLRVPFLGAGSWKFSPPSDIYQSLSRFSNRPFHSNFKIQNSIISLLLLLLVVKVCNFFIWTLILGQKNTKEWLFGRGRLCGWKIRTRLG